MATSARAVDPVTSATVRSAKARIRTSFPTPAHTIDAMDTTCDHLDRELDADAECQHHVGEEGAAVLQLGKRKGCFGHVMTDGITRASRNRFQLVGRLS